MDVILQKVVPTLGAIISTGMYFSPLSAVLKANKERAIGDLNALPFAVTVANTIVWLVYGLLKHDPFVMSSNVPGLPAAMFCTMSVYGLVDEKVRAQLRTIVCGTLLILPILGVVSSFGSQDPAVYIGLWGIMGNIIALVYYAAPLSSMAEVIKSRNSVSILLPLTIMNTANATLWTIYGTAINDPYVYGINALGLLLSGAQIALRMLFPATPKSSTPLLAPDAISSSGDIHTAPQQRTTNQDLETTPLVTATSSESSGGAVATYSVSSIGSAGLTTPARKGSRSGEALLHATKAEASLPAPER
ncbi:MAG: hypothetical protein WDW36_006433 [Sanguina aurantia]